MKHPVFLTGATGFLGMEVLARLVEKGDRDVVALVRAADVQRPGAPARRDGQAVARPVAVLTTASARSPATSPRPAWAWTRAERADVAEEVTAVMHCAASISFDLPLDEARQINVEGTREIIGFAREAKSCGRLDRFVHVAPPTSPESRRACSASVSSTRARSSATPTSRRSGRPSTSSTTRPTWTP